MNDKFIKSQRTGQIATLTLRNAESDIELSVTVDRGMYGEYIHQLGNKTYLAAGRRIFEYESDMISCAEYFAPNGSLSKNRPMTADQIKYMQSLDIDYELSWTVADASAAIENKLAEKNE